MDLWFTEKHTDDVNFTIKVKKQLYSGKSYYQQIDVFDTYEFGRVLVLDGFIMLTEKDEYIYHEMVTAVPMAVDPDIKNVLVIGAGDGGTIRELTRYPGIEKIDMVEIDEQVVEICKQYLPQTACKFDDERVNLFFEDGLKFVRRKEDEYDLIIVDSTDPGGPGEALFNETFYAGMKRALTPGGVIASQAESIYLLPEIVKRLCVITNHLFRYCGYASILVPTYPTGTIGARLASDGRDVTTPAREPSPEMAAKLRYYTPAIHRAAFTVPKFAEELITAR